MGASTEAAEQVEHLVAFRLAGETYGIEIALVQEIIRVCAITQVPRAAADVEGVINLRGKIVPVLDLARRLGLDPVERDPASRIIVIETGGMIVGLIVDGVTGVIRLPAADVEPPSELIGDPDTDYVRGVAKCGTDLIILLNVRNALRLEHVA